MPEFLTFSLLEQMRGKLTVNEAIIIKTASASIENKNIFLSHSSKDNHHLPVVIKLLENHGGSVYIDDGDSRLPEKPSKTTAAILRDTIQKLSRFVLFVTTNSKNSKWIPWELGLADAYKMYHNVALLPATESKYNQTWAEQEYLGLYRRIVWGDIKGHDKSCWMVYDHIANTAKPLSDWIRGY